MPRLAKAYKLPPQSMPHVDINSLPSHWIQDLKSNLMRLCSTFSGRRFDDKTQNMPSDLRDCLAVIYVLLHDPKVSEDNKTAIAVKLNERVQHCNDGFHTGVRSLLEALVAPKNIDDLLYRVRKEMVGQVARSIASNIEDITRGIYEVHDENMVWRCAENAYYGVRTPNPYDDYSSEPLKLQMWRGSVTDKLRTAFKPFKAFFALNKVLEELKNSLYNAGYPGRHEADEPYTSETLQGCGDVIANIFPDWSIVQERTRAMTQKNALDKQLQTIKTAKQERESSAIQEAQTLMAKFLDGLRDPVDPSLTLYEGESSVKQRKLQALFTNPDGSVADILDASILKTQFFSITDAFKDQLNRRLKREAKLTDSDIDSLDSIRTIYQDATKTPPEEEALRSDLQTRIASLEEGAISNFNNTVFERAPVPEDILDTDMEEDWNTVYIDLNMDKIRWKLLKKMVNEHYLVLNASERQVYEQHCNDENINAIGEGWLTEALSSQQGELCATELSSFMQFFSDIDLVNVLPTLPALSVADKEQYLNALKSGDSPQAQKVRSLLLFELQMASVLQKIHDKKTYYDNLEQTDQNAALSAQFDALHTRLQDTFTTFSESDKGSQAVVTVHHAWKTEFEREDTKNLMNTHRAWGWSVLRDLLVMASIVGILVRAVQYAIGTRHTIFFSRTNTAEYANSAMDKLDETIPIIGSD